MERSHDHDNIGKLYDKNKAQECIFFSVKGKMYQLLARTYATDLISIVFTKVFKSIVGFLRRKKARTCISLDDLTLVILDWNELMKISKRWFRCLHDFWYVRKFNHKAIIKYTVLEIPMDTIQMIMLLPNRYMNPKCYSVPNKESIFIR